MNTELSAIMSDDGRLVEWANTLKYAPANLSSEDKEISAVMDAWAKEIGRTGFDRDHEISQLITKSITLETVSAASELIDSMFETDSIGEFDDYRAEVDPKNTIKVYDAVVGGNVDRSFIDHKVLKPTWNNLQAETDLSLQQLRRGGYKSVANMVNFINEAFELEKVARVIDIIDKAITAGNGAFSEAEATPSDAVMKSLALRMMDVTNGDMPVIFGQNKYIMAIAGLSGATTYLTDAVKNQYNTTGKVTDYAGCRLVGLSGVKKLANGNFIIPDKKLFATAGKIGTCITRGDTLVQQETDINSEKIHIKVSGYSFGTLINDAEKAAKVTFAK